MQKRIQYLDGLRGISILMVLVGHSAPSFHLPAWLWFLGNSHLGVMIFFNISGFLITSLILKEIREKGHFSLKGFYKRRALRIFPVFYFFLLVIFLLSYNDIINIDATNIQFAALHLWNYKEVLSNAPEGLDIWYIGHLWTLALEEQFYLFWPLILFLFDSKKIIKILPFILLSFPFIRFGSYFMFPDLRGQIGIMFHTMGDSILWGAFGALLLHHRNDRLLKFLNYLNNQYTRIAIILFLFIISGLLSRQFGGSYSITIGYTLESVCIGALILYLITHSPPAFAFLNNKYLMYTGTLSYSLYIWQQLFLASPQNSLYYSFPLNLLLCFACAFVSYNTIEKLGLYIKSRL